MRVTKEQMAEHRHRILDAAGRLFREKGFAAVTLAEVMQAAGLTHGGFYGHFKSKDDLIAQTLAHLRPAGDPGAADLAGYAANYLDGRHRDDCAGGCPVAALASDTIRQSPEARAAMTEGLRQQIDRLTTLAPGQSAAEKRAAAIAGWSAMVGGLILARLSDDAALSEEVLAAARTAISAASAPAAQRPRARG